MIGMRRVATVNKRGEKEAGSREAAQELVRENGLMRQDEWNDSGTTVDSLSKSAVLRPRLSWERMPSCLASNNGVGDCDPLAASSQVLGCNATGLHPEARTLRSLEERHVSPRKCDTTTSLATGPGA